MEIRINNWHHTIELCGRLQIAGIPYRLAMGTPEIVTIPEDAVPAFLALIAILKK